MEWTVREYENPGGRAAILGPMMKFPSRAKAASYLSSYTKCYIVKDHATRTYLVKVT